MSSDRGKQIAERVRMVLQEMIDRELKDPRVHAAGFVGVNHVELSRDGSVARAYVSFYAGDGRGTPADAMAGLEASAGFLRGHVGRRLGLKRAPELRFVHDDSPDLQARISQIVRDDAGRGDGD